MAIPKAKEDDRLGATQVVVAKKAREKDKKAKDKFVQVIAGAALIDKIMRHGISVLNGLKKNELYALLVHADPNASIPKPSKKVGLEKARE